MFVTDKFLGFGIEIEVAPQNAPEIGLLETELCRIVYTTGIRCTPS
jgi:hypothetical protein